MTKYHDVRGGYSSASSYLMVMEGAGGSIPGSRVLMMNGAPDHIQGTHKRIAGLAEQQQTAVFIVHVGTHDCEGMVLTVKQRSRLNNLNEDEVYADLAEARVALVEVAALELDAHFRECMLAIPA